METSVQINELSDLLQELQKTEGNAEQINEIMNRTQLSADELSKYQHWSDDHYTRNCIIRNDRYELILMCWGPNQVTKIHDHNLSDGWVYCVDGNITEERFEPTRGSFNKISEATLEPGQFGYINDNIGYHRLRNPLDRGSMTLHLYASPISQCELYSDDMTEHETAYMSYYSIDGELQ